MEERLRPLIGREEWVALYFRLQNLEAFSEAYGFLVSDEALRTVADTLNEVVAELGGDEDFVGHLGEADFVLVTSPARVEALRNEIATRLPRALRKVAPPRPGGVEEGSAAPHLEVGVGVLTGADLPSDQEVSKRVADGSLSLEPLPLDA